ncbi:MAG TPA: carbohydrate-binding family 9-like protein [Thermoanaerobaculia bacterium]|nr:carbohydrate-binding family 9-like protein [Thermoanaerobaculia bacterium]
MSIPRWTVPRRLPWDEIPPHSLVLADGSGKPKQGTLVRLCWDDEALHVRFDCEDRDAWGTFRERDDPLWQEEVVEVFLAPWEEDPVRYIEIEVSPLGVLFDAVIHNPTGLRADMTADLAWDCPGLRWQIGRGTQREDWWAELSIPWETRSRIWRANFYRVERPRDGEPEFTCWSPTLTSPADFHKPARFGLLELGDI